MSPIDRPDQKADDRARRDGANAGDADAARRRATLDETGDRRDADATLRRRNVAVDGTQARREAPETGADATAQRRDGARAGGRGADDPASAGPRGRSGVTRRAVIGAGLALAGAAALRPIPAVAAPGRDVLATTGMIADIAKRVGGARVDVTALMGSGIDPHSYRQTRSDVARLARADLVLRHGLRLEAQMDELLDDLARRSTVLAIAETMPTELLHPMGDGTEQFDPHIWMDPRLWARMIDPVRDALSSLDPAGAGLFAANAIGARAEYERLALYADEAIGSIPEARRLLITAHDAFGYFGAAFGLEVEGIQGISTESEAGLARIEALVALLVTRDVGAVFVESSVPARNVRALIEGAAARGRKVIIGGELFSDAMGAIGTYEGTYPGMIDHNVTVIARALGGIAPARGMRGQLSAGL